MTIPALKAHSRVWGNVGMFFISCQKLFSFLRYLQFCSDHVGKQFHQIRKLRLISKFVKSQTRQQIISKDKNKK